LGIAIAATRAGGEHGQSAERGLSALTLAPIVVWLLVRHWKNTGRAFTYVAIAGFVFVGLLVPFQLDRDATALTAVFGLCMFSAPAFYIFAIRRTKDRRRGQPEPKLHWTYIAFGAAMPVIVSFLTFVLFARLPATPSYLGVGSIVLIAGIAWLPLLSVLHWLSMKLRLPLLIVFFLIAIGLSWADLNDNHQVRAFAGKAAPAPPAPEFESAFKQWLRARKPPPKDKPVNVVLVAAEGGGIYAAYYTAQVLATQQDSNPAFADSIFAISGVSGGSVGAAVFSALVEHSKHDQILDKDWFTKTSHEVLKQDFLSSLLASALLEDMLQQFIVPPFARWDRARSLETAFERAWKSATKTEHFEQPFDALWVGQGVPSLVLNATEVESGERVVISNLAFDPAKAPHLSSLRGLDGKLVPCLSTAACLSARFPLITPAAWIQCKAEPPLPAKRRLVDGGYYENTGIETAISMYYAMRRIVRADTSLPKCRFILIRIGSKDGKPAPPFQGLGEALSPVRAMLHARQARSQEAIARLDELTDEYNPDRTWTPESKPELIEFVLDTNRKYPIPLGWLLSDLARNEIRDQLVTAEESRRLRLDDPAAIVSADTAHDIFIPSPAAPKAGPPSTAPAPKAPLPTKPPLPGKPTAKVTLLDKTAEMPVRSQPPLNKNVSAAAKVQRMLREDQR
jgi:predicted acylesterase/phospholipase RssA